MKSTMNNRNIAKYHKLLDGGASVKQISNYLRVDVKTLKKFSPERVAAANKIKSDIAKKVIQEKLSPEDHRRLLDDSLEGIQKRSGKDKQED